MIALRKINKEEYLKAKSILEKENIKDDLLKGIVYVFIDNNIIIGVGKIRLEGDYGVLEYVIIEEEYRGLNLGDALLRSLLFKAESIGIKKIFYYNMNDYLFKKGFKYGEEETGSYKMFLNIEDFFSKGCCSYEDEI
ncbi:MAG: GNAT family N-acetyltransferase [Tissierellia bacterium]|nr:GNAT family N-acetyltransferase [Tissierellia bacterium]